MQIVIIPFIMKNCVLTSKSLQYAAWSFPGSPHSLQNLLGIAPCCKSVYW